MPARISPSANRSRIARHRKNRLRDHQTIRALGGVVFVLFLGEAPSGFADATAEVPASPNTALTALTADAAPRRTGAFFAASCAPCHVAPESGAPQIGRVADWRPRAIQGRAKLLEHTIDGYLDMPPLGSCGGCTVADFKALIELLVPKAAWDASPRDAEKR